MSFRHIPLLLLLFAALSAPAQTLRVLDRTTGQPVGSVALFTPSMNKSVITDSRGIASLDIFGRNDTVIFQHASYQRLTVTVEDLLRHEGKVWLVPRVVMLSESVVSVNRWEQNKEEVPNRFGTFRVFAFRDSSGNLQSSICAAANYPYSYFKKNLSV